MFNNKYSYIHKNMISVHVKQYKSKQDSRVAGVEFHPALDVPRSLVQIKHKTRKIQKTPVYILVVPSVIIRLISINIYFSMVIIYNNLVMPSDI